MPSPTPLTEKEIVNEIKETLNEDWIKDLEFNVDGEFKHSARCQVNDFIKKIESLLTTLTTQHTKEKEELMREMNTELNMAVFSLRGKISAIAKKHNITI